MLALLILQIQVCMQNQMVSFEMFALKSSASYNASEVLRHDEKHSHQTVVISVGVNTDTLIIKISVII